MLARMRVLLVDDHRLVTEMLSDALAQAADVEVVGVATSGEEGIQLARHHRPDVVRMDVEMAGISGVEATREIVQSLPDTRVVMLTANDDQTTVLDASEAGAVGSRTKDKALVEDIPNAVERAHAGEIMLPTQMIGRLINSLAQRRRE